MVIIRSTTFLCRQVWLLCRQDYSKFGYCVPFIFSLFFSSFSLSFRALSSSFAPFFVALFGLSPASKPIQNDKVFKILLCSFFATSTKHM